MSNIQPTTVVGTVTEATNLGAHGGPIGQRGGSVLGPFNLRELVIFGSVLLMLIGSVIPVATNGAGNFWNTSGIYFLIIGIVLPLVVAALFLVRRLNKMDALRVGTLTQDQFASVVASFAAGYFFLLVVGGFKVGFLISFIGALGLLASTVAAKWLPFFGAAPVVASAIAAIGAGSAVSAENLHPAPVEQVDVVASTFAESETPAASEEASVPEAPNEVAPAEPEAVVSADAAADPAEQAVSPVAETISEQPEQPEQPKQPIQLEQPEQVTPAVATPPSFAAAPEPAAPEPSQEHAPEVLPVREPESFGAVVDPATRPVQDTAGQLVYEAFWFAVEQPKPVLDERTGGFLFNIEPGVWFLALQDRGQDFIVQNSDGRVGVLRDLSNIERAPENG